MILEEMTLVLENSKGKINLKKINTQIINRKSVLITLEEDFDLIIICKIPIKMMAKNREIMTEDIEIFIIVFCRFHFSFR